MEIPWESGLVWTPVGLQTRNSKNVQGCKPLKRLVGPPRFELGTSCTPSKRASQAAPRPEVLIVLQTMSRLLRSLRRFRLVSFAYFLEQGLRPSQAGSLPHK